MYIVAFRHIHFPIILEEVETGRQRDYINNDLDAERKIRKESRSGSSLELRRN
jgi:hypothetical protein